MRKVEKGGGRKALSSTRWMQGGGIAWCFTHAPVSAQWAMGSSNSVPWVISLVCWPRRVWTLSSQQIHYLATVCLSKLKEFSWRFSLLPPWLQILKMLWATVPERLPTLYLWNSPLFTVVKRPYPYSPLLKHMKPTRRLFLAEWMFSNSCWGHAWYYCVSQKETGIIDQLLSQAVTERKISLVDLYCN